MLTAIYNFCWKVIEHWTTHVPVSRSTDEDNTGDLIPRHSSYFIFTPSKMAGTSHSNNNVQHQRRQMYLIREMPEYVLSSQQHHLGIHTENISPSTDNNQTANPSNDTPTNVNASN